MDWVELQRLNAELIELQKQQRAAERAEDFVLARRYRELFDEAEFRRARLVRQIAEDLAHA